MQFNTVVLSLLQARFWSITPALPGVGGGPARSAVGAPDVIPDVTFIARELTTADGVTPAERDSLNKYTRQARQYHQLFGIHPIVINSFDDVLRHFETVVAPIGRIRLISHGTTQGLLLAVFTGGKWDLGMDARLLDALAMSNEAALRWLITNGGSAAASPTFQDGRAVIVAGMNAIPAHAAIVAPFAAPAANPAVVAFFDVVNDRYQVRNGTVVVGNALVSASQQATLNASLDIIEAAVRARVTAATPLTDAQLTAYKNAVLAETPARLGFFGPVRDLPATVINDVQTAPQTEVDLRLAMGAPAAGSVFDWDYLASIVAGLEIFQRNTLRLGGTDHDAAMISADADLFAFVSVAMDLHHLRNAHTTLTINNAPLTAAERTTLRNALIAIGNDIRTRIPAPVTAAQLNALRTAIENRPVRESGVTGGVKPFEAAPVPILPELAAANNAMQGGFRARYDHFRGLIQPGNASKLDFRGCFVGASLPYMVTLRNFLGTATNKPQISAPDWWQSFPFSSEPRGEASIFGRIDDLKTNGLPVIDVTGADVMASFDEWRALIDFDPHFTFITGLFAAGASLRDFASLAWRVFAAGGNPGIPVLKMEAARVDDLPALNLDQVIERFRVIFEIPAATPPNATARARLNQLQPHVRTHRTIADAIAATPAPTQPQLDQFLTDLTNVKNSIVAIPGFPAPAPPLNAPAAPATLAQIQAFSTAIATHLDTILAGDLNAFFAAVQPKTQDANANIRYYFNVGLPLLVRSSSHPTRFALVSYVSGPSPSAQKAVLGKAFRSWLRIQWTGTPVQAAAVNTAITNLALTTSTEFGNAGRVMMVSEDEPEATPTSPAEIHPTAGFRGHVVTRP